MSKNVIAILTSDVHLGDLYCNIGKFERFLAQILREIKNGSVAQLECMLFLGDTFDLMMSTYKHLCNDSIYSNCYNLLQTIQDQGIRLIFILGNHEIPTTGYYNLLFGKRKLDFLYSMKQGGLKHNFLKKNGIYQYAIIKNNQSNQFTLALYDSLNKPWIDLVGFNETQSILLVANKAPINNSYLITHGHQFEDWQTHHFVSAPWWKSFMGLKEDAKRVINEFWHDWKEKKDENDKEGFFNYINSLKINKTNMNSIQVEEVIPNGRHQEKTRRFFDNALLFLENNGLTKINHVIFGHIHEFNQVRSGNVLLTTNGCWLEDKRSYFTEILANGNCTQKQVE
ncbi:MAG: metallophosphoesterase [Candidatus Lokiarchaeota archaeon]|nr:metallophosphoesterase [Candidatus Lokiarchaeota archaeon]